MQATFYSAESANGFVLIRAFLLNYSCTSCVVLVVFYFCTKMNMHEVNDR